MSAPDFGPSIAARAAWVAYLIRQGKTLEGWREQAEWLEQLLVSELTRAVDEAVRQTKPPAMKGEAFDALRTAVAEVAPEVRQALVEALLTASDELDEQRAETVHAIAAAILPPDGPTDP